MSYHGSDSKHVTIVTFAGVVFSYVREVRQVIGVLTRAVDVADLMFAHQFLREN